MKEAHAIPVSNIKPFIMGGHATITLHNINEDRHLTYKISLPKKVEEGKPYPLFVGVLTGPNNEESYTYLGLIWGALDGNLKFVHAKKSKIGWDATSSKAFRWFFNHVVDGKDFPAGFEALHHGHCGVCGRKLTTPESIEAGIGPVCLGKVA